MGEYLVSRSGAFQVALAVGLVVLIGIVDRRTEPELSLALLYLVPIFQATWFAGRRTRDLTTKGGAGMSRVISKCRMLFVVSMAIVLWGLSSSDARAHCDTMNGPVVNTARMALDKGDVTPVLKWVRKENEDEIKEQFQKTLAARKQGKEARELVDRYFFETLVRIHRAGEGAPYSGLKSGPAEPIIQAADEALESGSADQLVEHVSDAVTAGIRERFNRAKEAKKHADESIAKGREFVEAYVIFTHYVERIHMDVAAGGEHQAHGEKEEKATEHHH